jgi:malonyl-CoA/methylmalonyl-CoA synthetase
VEAWEWESRDRILNVLPLNHIHGVINVLSCSLWSGATCEFLPRFEAGRVFEALSSGRFTLFMAVPTIYVKLISVWEKASSEERERFSEACGKMRLMVSGSAALPVSVLEKWRSITGQTLLERYGMTEIGMGLANPLRGLRKPGSVGMPLPGVEVMLADEVGRPVTREGVSGEIYVRGKTVFSEYWARPDATQAAFRRDWFRTGDIAVVEKGYYRIQGRSSVDIIKTGGYKVSALEIEEVLRSHPLIRECAVVGTEDPVWGERVSAAVLLSSGNPLVLQDLRRWAADKLAQHKLPSRLLTVDEFPRNAVGKVQKKQVRDLFDAGDIE